MNIVQSGDERTPRDASVGYDIRLINVHLIQAAHLTDQKR